MTADEVLDALALPAATRIDRRIAKDLLAEHGAASPTDRRRIADGVDELRWVAALKPANTGVPASHDPIRGVAEVHVLLLRWTEGADRSRLAVLIHRAIPYPVLLVDGCPAADSTAWISVARKQVEESATRPTVLDGAVLEVDTGVVTAHRLTEGLRDEVRLDRQSRADLRAMYEGWIAVVLAAKASEWTRSFAVLRVPADAAFRAAAISEHERLDGEIARIYVAASRETQLARQVDLNLELGRLRAARDDARARM